MKILTIALFGAVLCGCATATEADRELNHQTVDAARGALALMAAASGDPASVIAAVAVVVSDIQKNAEQIQASLGGPPKQPKPYSAEESEKKRKESKESHETPWWKMILGGAGSLLLGWLGRGGLARLFPVFAGGLPGLGLSLVTEAIARVREQAASSDGTIKLEGEGGLLETLTEVAQKNPAAHEIIRALAHKAEAKLGVKL